MFDRWAEEGRGVMRCAAEEARRLGHEYIGTEHLLLGILRMPSCEAALLLAKTCEDIDRVRREIEQRVEPAREILTRDQLPFTPRMKWTLDKAMSVATEHRHGRIGTDHLILALASAREGIAAESLRAVGVDHERLRQAWAKRSTSSETGIPMGRPHLSVCVITMNEEANLKRCLASLAPLKAGEIVVLDSGSTDKTREIAEKAGARVFIEPFPGHIEQKNRAIDLSAGEWILSLDADEALSPELAAEIAEKLRTPDATVAAYSMPRRNRYLGRWIRHGGWHPDRKVRLFRRDAGRWGGVNPHDKVVVDGRVEKLSNDILHDSYKSLSHHAKTIDTFTTTMAAERAKRGKRFSLFRLVFEPPARFLRMYVLQLGFLDGLPGFIAARNAAYYVFLRHAKQYESERVKPE